MATPGKLQRPVRRRHRLFLCVRRPDAVPAAALPAHVFQPVGAGRALRLVRGALRRAGRAEPVAGRGLCDIHGREVRRLGLCRAESLLN